MILHNLKIDHSLFPTLLGVYIVGGTTRDLLLGKTPVDYDIAVLQNPEIFAKKTAHAGSGRLVRMGRPGKRSYRVVTDDTILDITGISGPTIRHDLERRDVTINAMAIELSSGTLLDWTGGQRDLAGKRIRMVSENGFRDDPIRLLRALRLAAALGFSIEDRTVSTITRDAHLIHLSAGERIRSELFQLFSCRDSAPHVNLMASTGLLRAIFPEPASKPAEIGTAPPDAGLQTDFPPAYVHLESLLNHPPPGYPARGTGIEPSLPPNPAAWLKFANILACQNRRPDGGELPENHEKDMVDTARSICHRLRLSTKEDTFVTGIVANRNRPFYLHKAFKEEKLTPKAVTRFFMTAGPLAQHLLMFAMAEARSRSKDPESFSDFIQHMFRTYLETYLPAKARPPLVSGRDLMSIFGLQASPLFKQILARIEEGRLSGEITDRASALSVAEKMVREHDNRI